MRCKTEQVPTDGVKFVYRMNGEVIGRATLIVGTNERGRFALLEDVFVDEASRGQGLGTTLVRKVIAEAKKRGCYKIIATSRYGREHIHDIYLGMGFADHGKEFRMELIVP